MCQHKPRRGLAAERGSKQQGRKVGKCGRRWFNQVDRESHPGQKEQRQGAWKEGKHSELECGQGRGQQGGGGRRHCSGINREEVMESQPAWAAAGTREPLSRR